MKLTPIVLPESLRPVECGPLVRLGADRDGGYVIPERCIEAADVLLSFGLSANWEFEKALLARKRAAGRELAIHAYDHTVSARSLLVFRLKSLIHLAMRRDAAFWRAFRRAAGYSSFFNGTIATHFEEMVSWRDGYRESSIAKILSRIGEEQKVFLSMDIEGSEYRVADDLIRASSRFVGMGVEFHDLDILRSRFFEIHSGLSKEFAVAHLHVNNVMGLGPDGFPNLLEITYIHRSLIDSCSKFSDVSLPMAGLDMANVESRPDFSISFE